MKQLYISDLDGTLLQADVTLSTTTVSILNDLIHNGVAITIATARTIASVKYILKDVDIQLPIILMNGVAVYDLKTEQYIKVENIPYKQYKQIISLAKQFKEHCFIYTIDIKGGMKTYYDALVTHGMIDFYQERVTLYNKSFQKLDSFEALGQEPVVYFAFINTYDHLVPLYQEISKLEQINCVFYKDNYTTDIWYLEVYSEHASKYHALEYLKHYLNIDHVTCFGDNRNDLPLFEASTYKIAVKNGIKELKAKANEVIGYHYDDAVAHWLKRNSLA